MRYLLIFTLFMVACSDETPNKCIPFEVITVSDLNPIQFWQADCDTYNQKEVCGVHRKCFCQPWICDTEMTLQIKDTNPDGSYDLKVYSEEGDLLATIPFTQQLFFLNPFDFVFNNESFESSITGWDQYGTLATEAIWTWNNPSSAQADGTSGTRSRTYQLYQDRTPGIGGYSKWPPGTYQFTVRVANTSSGGSSPLSEGLEVRAVNTLGDVISESTVVTVARGFAYNDYTLNLTTTQEWNYLTFHLYKQGPSSGSAVLATIDFIEIEEAPLDYSGSVYTVSFIPSEYDICDQRVKLEIVESATPQETAAKSDCIDIRTSYDCVTTIEYSNNRNFAGITFADQSPELSFKAIIPAIFFHQRFPEEDNIIQLSDQIVKLNGTVMSQRLFETDYIPYYMHKKLQLIFKLQTILIDGQYWVKEEGYEIQEGERRWPVKKGKVFLTERDDLQRAIL